MIIYDIEIRKAIQNKGEELRPGIKYCDGWQDHVNMGVSCICAYDYTTDRYRTFFEDNMDEFSVLIYDQDRVVGFNNIEFDNKVIAANGIVDEQLINSKSYDILRQIWTACDLGPKFEYPSHIGYGLDAVVKANGLAGGKTGHGAIAPVDYQEGKYGSLVDYCLADVWLTKKVLDKIIRTGTLISPKDGKTLRLVRPR